LPRLTKRMVETLRPVEKPYFAWDEGDGAVKGFGIAVHPSGKLSFIAQFRIGKGRAAQSRRVTIGAFGTFTVEEAREKARDLIRDAASGIDREAEVKAKQAAELKAKEAADRERQRARTLRFERLAVRFLREHVKSKRKPRTWEAYRQIVASHLLPPFRGKDAREITRQDVAALHLRLSDRPTMANRCVDVLSSLYGWADSLDLLPEGFRNPTSKIEKYPEHAKERFLSVAELQRLGEAIRLAETAGIPWNPDPNKKTKHAPKAENRVSHIDPDAAAALRLLIFTGARLREILHLEWEAVDLERGLLRLRDSKTGPKIVVLNVPARAILAGLSRRCPFVFPGEGKDGRAQPRADLKRPWRLVSKAAGLEGVRLHDLRHSFASIGAGDGHGLVIVGKLLGHSQSRTTERYAHLDNDPLRQASDAIAARIAEAMGEATPSPAAKIIPITRSKTNA